MRSSQSHDKTSAVFHVCSIHRYPKQIMDELSPHYSIMFHVVSQISCLSTPAFCTSTVVTHHPCQINWNKTSFHELIFRVLSVSTLMRPNGMG
jgi:hypothetical protein